MMDDLSKVVIPAVIALVGTLTVALIAYSQWRRQAQVSRRLKFGEERVRAVQELWDKVQNIHLEARKSVDNPRDDDVVRDQLKDFNSFIIRRALYLESEEVSLARHYLASVEKFVALLRLSANMQIQDDFAITATIFIPEELEDLRQAGVQMEEAFNQLRMVTRRIILGTRE
jgi:hypothetical protein